MSTTAPARQVQQWAWGRGVLRLAATHPRSTLAVKAAVASVIAWIAVRPIDGVVDDYPYYAPLGAVIAVSTTVTSSAREAVRAVLAIALGASLALGVDFWLGQGLLTLGLVVALGTLLAGWRRLGGMASWVPVAALFVLILGNADDGAFALAYAGLTGFGALVGVAVNMLFPPLPLNTADQTLQKLRDTMADQFDELSEALRNEKPLSVEDWETRRRTVESVSAETQESIREAADAQRANWRARRWQEQAKRQYDAALILEQLPFIVEDVGAILVHETSGAEALPWSDPLRPRIAATLECAAEFLRSITAAGAGEEESEAMDNALNALTDQVRDSWEQGNDNLFGVAGLVTTLSRLRASARVR